MITEGRRTYLRAKLRCRCGRVLVRADCRSLCRGTENIRLLHKALERGYNEPLAGGSELKIEDLDTRLLEKSTTVFDDARIKLWRKLSK